MIPALTCRDQRVEQIGFTIPDSAQPGPGIRPYPVRLGQPGRVLAAAELVDRLLQPRVDLQQPGGVGVCHELTPITRHPRRQVASGNAFQVVDQTGACGDVTGGQIRLAADQQQLGVQCGVGAGQRGTASGLAAGRSEFVAVECAARRRQIVARRAQGELTGLAVAQSQITPVSVGGFEIAGDDLVGFERRTGAAGVHPVRQPLMQLGSLGFQQPAIGDIADEDVMEPPHRLVARVDAARLGEVEAAQPVQRRHDLGSADAGQRGDRAGGEVRADYRGDFEHASVAGIQPLEPGRQQRLDRRRNRDRVYVHRQVPPTGFRDQHTVVDEHPDQFPHEQRVPARRRGQPNQQFIRQVATQHPGGEFGGGIGRQTAQWQRVGDPAADGQQIGPGLPQFGTGERDQQHRSAPHPLDEVLDEVEQ